MVSTVHFAQCRTGVDFVRERQNILMYISETFSLSTVNLSSMQGIKLHDHCALLFDELVIQGNLVESREVADCVHWEGSHQAPCLLIGQVQGDFALSMAGCLVLACELLNDWEQLHPEGFTGVLVEVRVY